MEDLLNYKGKVCVVTGAASGMGEAVAEYLIDLGAEVYALDIKEPSINGTKYIQLDLTKKDSIDSAVKELPDSVDSIFNCAGSAGGDGFSTLDVITINFIGPIYLIDSLVPRMPASSSIAAIASTGGMNWRDRKDTLLPLVRTDSFEEAQDWVNKNEDILIKDDGHINKNPVYNFSKELIICWMKDVAYNLTERKIRINTLSPGATLTPMTSNFNKIAGSNFTDEFVSGIGRQSTPQEQAKVLLFLNSDLASYVSGQDLQADYAYVTTFEM